jgi:UDP:flavonoid glycosyltransferase YjiC (YdhE family)
MHVIERALELSGMRAVISTGGAVATGALVSPGGAAGRPPHAESSPRTFFEEDVPHSWLFPRVTAVMHHGGAGTTAEGLRAGVPSIIVPGAADQYFWAERIARLGAGPLPVASRDLTPGSLARLFVRVATDVRMRERARLIGARIRNENGVARAVEALLPLLG